MSGHFNLQKQITVLIGNYLMDTKFRNSNINAGSDIIRNSIMVAGRAGRETLSSKADCIRSLNGFRQLWGSGGLRITLFVTFMIPWSITLMVFAESALAQRGQDVVSLQINGADESIVQAEIQGPVSRYPEVFMGAEDFHNPRVQRLREEYDFLAEIVDEKSEFRKQLLLRHWIFNQWPIDDSQSFGGDAFEILHRARTTDEGFHCSHATKVQQAVMTASGYVARNLGVDRNHLEFGRSYHHGVNEIWSNEHAKWVMFDAKYDNHFERDGIPLSAAEIHGALRAGDREQIQMVMGPDRKPVPHPEPDVYGARVDSYWWVSYHLKQDPFTQPHFAGGSTLVVWDNEAFRTTTWYRGAGEGLAPSWAYEAEAFMPVALDQIEWTPGVTNLENIRQVEQGRLNIRPASATPNLKGYHYRINGGAWQNMDGGESINWPLSEGMNTLEVQSRNLFGVEGPVATAKVHYQP